MVCVLMFFQCCSSKTCFVSFISLALRARLRNLLYIFASVCLMFGIKTFGLTMICLLTAFCFIFVCFLSKS